MSNIRQNSRSIKQAISAILVASLLGLATTACGSKSDSAANLPTVEITLDDYMLMPHELKAPAGKVKIHVLNKGETPHNFTIKKLKGEGALEHSPDLKKGESVDLTVTLEKGTYDTLCSLPGHASLGMTGLLVVS